MSLLHERALAQDLVAADGELLVRAGEPLTEALRAEIDRKGQRARRLATTLREAKVPEDLGQVVSDPLYRVVFEDREGVGRLGEALGAVSVPSPVAEELRRLRDLDEYTYRHVLITALLTARMLEQLGWSQGRVLEGACAALTHDFGKLRVCRDVLQKVGPLTGEELGELREHPRIGAVLLGYYFGGSSTHVRVALEHHERADGSGYPFGASETSPLVRLVALNDVFDALVSRRPYRRRAFDVRGALELLWDEVLAGRLEEGVFRLLVCLNRKGKPDPARLRLSTDRRSSAPEENNYGRIAGG